MAPSDCTPPPTHTHRCGRQRCGPSLPDLRSLPGDRAPHPQRQCRWPQSEQSLQQTARASAWFFVSGTVGGPKDSELVILVPPCPRYVTWDNESTYQEGLPGGSFASEDIPPRPGRGTGQPRLLERRVHRMLPGRGGESVAPVQLPSGGPSSTPEGTVGLHMEPD